MEINTVIVDNGASFVRAGFGGEEEPKCIIPTVVGTKRKEFQDGIDTKDYYLSSDISRNVEQFNLHFPINNRVIQNHDEMTKIWDFMFNSELHIETKDHPVLMTESPQNEKDAREKTTEIMMEKYSCPAFHMAYPETLALYVIGKTTGTVIDIGETMTHVVPVYKSFGMTFTTTSLPIGGRQINHVLKKRLKSEGIIFSSEQDRDTIRSIKETVCMFGPEGDESPVDYTLPDGTTLQIPRSAVSSPDVLFHPKYAKVKSKGLPELVTTALGEVDEDIKEEVGGTVVLIGGSSLFPGLKEQLAASLPSANVIATPGRRLQAWLGGSKLASLSTFSQMWISQAEYNEVGPPIVHLKCF